MGGIYKIQVFGKPGCDKCAVLNQRLDKLLQDEQWKDFEKEYCSLDTEEGLVAFAESECVNPQRVPAFVVRRFNAESGEYEMMSSPPGPGPGSKTRLHSALGLQTDYSPEGRGVLSPQMIELVLKEAASQSAPA
jgi:hypothetical protein